MDKGRFAQGTGHLELARNDRGQQLFGAIAARIDTRFANPCTNVATVAAELGVTPRHLQRVMHSSCGLTFGQYLRRRRVVEAARLLLAAGVSLRIKEVAARVGLNDTRTLDRYFSREIGLTPGQFRARNLAPDRSGNKCPALAILQRSNAGGLDYSRPASLRHLGFRREGV